MARSPTPTAFLASAQWLECLTRMGSSLRMTRRKRAQGEDLPLHCQPSTAQHIHLPRTGGVHMHMQATTRPEEGVLVLVLVLLRLLRLQVPTSSPSRGRPGMMRW